MDNLRDLVAALRRRGAGLKAAATDCSPDSREDRLALQVRADEVARCVAAIEEAMAGADTEVC